MAKRRRTDGNGRGRRTSRQEPSNIEDTKKDRSGPAMSKSEPDLGRSEAITGRSEGVTGRSERDRSEVIAGRSEMDRSETVTGGSEVATDGTETVTGGLEVATDETKTVTGGSEAARDRSETVTDRSEEVTGSSRGSAIDSENRRQRWAYRCMIAELAVIILLLLLFLYLFWISRTSAKTAAGWMPEYEDNALADTEGADEAGDKKEISIAVMHNYLVNREQRDFTVGYPDQNTYEIEISFRDSESGEEKYHTKRIAPGTQVSVPGYEFCEDGTNRLDAHIRIYKPKSQVPVSDSTVMQFQVTKE